MDIQNSSGPERERDSKVRKDFRDWRDRKPTPTSPERERRKTKGEGVRFPESGVHTGRKTEEAEGPDGQEWRESGARVAD